MAPVTPVNNATDATFDRFEKKEEIHNNKKKADTILQSIQHKLHDADEEIRDQKYSRSECLCFFTFLIVFTTMAILTKGVGDLSFTQTISIRQSLIDRAEFKPWNEIGEKTFAEASTIGDIYAFLQDAALPFLLHDIMNNKSFIQSQQTLLGGLRLKQLRTERIDCDNEEFSTCYSNKLNTNNMTYYYASGDKATEFVYMQSSELVDQSWRGKYGTYDGGGYIYDLPLSYSSAMQQVQYLHNISWIDGGTKFVALDFNTFNPSTSLHTVSRLVWEMSTAGIFPNDEIKTWKFDRYSGADGSVLFVFYILFLLWVIGMTLMTFYSCWKVGCRKCGKRKDGTSTYWNSKWKGLDAINLCIFYISISLFIYNEQYRYTINMYNTVDFISFRQLQYGLTMETYSTALNGALLWIKLFKYLAINKRLRFLFTMLGHSSVDILMFVIVLSVFVIAFGTAGFVSFNSDVDDFRSYVFSMSNMVRFILVEMDYESLTLSSRLWGSAFYFLWSLLMLLILSNVFIAILVDGYTKVKADLTEEDGINLGDFGMSATASGIWTRLKSFSDLMSISKHEDLDVDNDGKISAKELAKQSNISTERARQIIDRYDVDDDGQLDKDEFEKLKQEIVAEKRALARSKKSERKSSRNRRKYKREATSSDDDRDNMNVIKMRKEFHALRTEVMKFNELLTAVLDQTSAGKRVLKQINQRYSLIKKK